MSTVKALGASSDAIGAAIVDLTKKIEKAKEKEKVKEKSDYTKPPEVKNDDQEYVQSLLLEGATEEAMIEETDELLKKFRSADIAKIDLLGLIELFKTQMIQYDLLVADADTQSKAYVCYPTLEGYNNGSNALHKAKQMGVRVETIKAMINQNFKETIGGASNQLLDSLHRLETTFEGPGIGGVHKVQKKHQQQLLQQIRLDLDIHDPYVRSLLDRNNHHRLFNNIHLVQKLYETSMMLLPQWFVDEYGLLLKDKNGLIPSGAKSAEDQKQYHNAQKQRAKENIPMAKSKSKNPDKEKEKKDNVKNIAELPNGEVAAEESTKKKVNKKKKHKKKKAKNVSSESSDSASATDSE